MRALRIGVCVLGILLILIMGKIGEEALGAVLVLLDKAGTKPEDLGTVTAFVVRNYHLNQNHFLLSLAPFLVILAGMPFLDRVEAQSNTRFWYAFASVLLVFMVYFCVFTYALLYPFTHIGVAADHEATAVTYATLTLSSLAIAVLVGLYVRVSRQKATAEPHAAADAARRRD